LPPGGVPCRIGEQKFADRFDPIGGHEPGRVADAGELGPVANCGLKCWSN